MKILVLLLYVFLIIANPLMMSANEPDLAPCRNIRINEVLPDPEGADKDNEWTELINLCEEEIDLTGYYLVDKSSAKHFLSETIAAGGFTLVYPVFSINQTDEEIFLYSPEGQLIDSMFYSSSKTNLAIARVPDGIGEWKMNRVPTPGDFNYIEYPNDIIISEIYPYPKQGESSWIELYNTSEQIVNLDMWRIQVSSSTHTIENTTLDPYSFVVISTRFSLSKQGSTLNLLNPNEKLVDTFTFGPTKQGISNILFKEAIVQTQQPSPGEHNIYVDPADKFYGLDKIDISEFKQKLDGNYYILTGKVVSPPDQLFTGKMHIMHNTEGIMVKLPADYPKLSKGDTVKICARLETFYDEYLANIEDANCLMKINEIINTSILENPKDLENSAGALVKVSGQIIKKDSNNLYVQQGEKTVKVYVKDVIDMKTLSTGDEITITGIVNIRGKNKDGSLNVRLMPLLANDISMLASEENIPKDRLKTIIKPATTVKRQQEREIIRPALKAPVYEEISDATYKPAAIKKILLSKKETKYTLLAGMLTNTTALGIWLKHYYNLGISSMLIH